MEITVSDEISEIPADKKKTLVGLTAHSQIISCWLLSS
jgi:hypothetical protein